MVTTDKKVENLTKTRQKMAFRAHNGELRMPFGGLRALQALKGPFRLLRGAHSGALRCL